MGKLCFGIYGKHFFEIYVVYIVCTMKNTLFYMVCKRIGLNGYYHTRLFANFVIIKQNGLVSPASTKILADIIYRYSCDDHMCRMIPSTAQAEKREGYGKGGHHNTIVDSHADTSISDPPPPQLSCHSYFPSNYNWPQPYLWQICFTP